MATEGIKERDEPFYGRLFRPIEPIAGQKSVAPSPGAPVGYAVHTGAPAGTGQGAFLKGLGQVIEGGTNLIGEAAKIGVTQTASNTFEPLMQQRIKELEGVAYGQRAASTSSPTPTSGDPNQPTEVSPQPAPETEGRGVQPVSSAELAALPPTAQKGIQQVAQLADFHEQGRVDNTMFLGNVHKISFDARAQLPLGLKNTWDRAVAQATGIPNTANAYIQALTHRINEAAANKDKLVNDVMHKLEGGLKYGDSIVEAIKNVKAGGDPYKALTILSRFEAADYQFEKKNREITAQRADEKYSREASDRQGALAVDELGREHTAAVVSSVWDHAGFSDVATNPEKMTAALEKVKNDPEKLDQLLQGFTIAKADNADYLRRKIDQPQAPSQGNPQGLSIRKLYGLTEDQVVAQIEKNNEPLNWPEKYLGTGSPGGASMLTHATRRFAQTEAATKQIPFDDPSTQAIARTITAARAVFGDQNIPAFLLSAAQWPKLSGQFTDLQGHIEQQFEKSVTEPGSSAHESIDSLHGTAKRMGLSDADFGKIVDAFTSKPEEVLTNPQLKAGREAFVNYYYGPKNAGMIGRLQDKQGDYYAKLFSPKITEEVHRLGGQAWETYKDRAKSAFSSEVALPLVHKMNDAAVQGAEFTYDDKTNTFDYNIAGQKNVATRSSVPTERGGFSLFDLTRPQFPELGGRKADILGGPTSDPYGSTIKELNRATTSAAAVAKATGQEPKAYIFGIFQQLGLSNTVAKQLGIAIQSTNPPKPQPKAEE